MELFLVRCGGPSPLSVPFPFQAAVHRAEPLFQSMLHELMETVAAHRRDLDRGSTSDRVCQDLLIELGVWKSLLCNEALDQRHRSFVDRLLRSRYAAPPWSLCGARSIHLESSMTLSPCKAQDPKTSFPRCNQVDIPPKGYDVLKPGADPSPWSVAPFRTALEVRSSPLCLTTNHRLSVATIPIRA